MAERRLARFLVPAALLAALTLGGTPPVQADGLSCPTTPGSNSSTRATGRPIWGERAFRCGYSHELGVFAVWIPSDSPRANDACPLDGEPTTPPDPNYFNGTWPWNDT